MCQVILTNSPAGTYDLRTGICYPNKYDDYLTKMTKVSPDTKNSDKWQEALNTFICNDQKLIEYVQQLVGLTAIGKVYQEELIIAYGDGSNGKSTFRNAISNIYDGYSGSITPEILTSTYKHNAKSELAELKGQRLTIAAELEEGNRLNTAMLKRLCSTDKIPAEKKYKDCFSFTPTHTLVLYTNHLPKVGSIDAGTWKRILIIPFEAKISGKSEIKNYTDYLSEHAGGAILTWIIEGAKKVIAADFKPEIPDVVQKAIEVYRNDNDWITNFIKECCETDATYVQASSEIYVKYREYCQENGEYTRTQNDFTKALETAGFSRKRSSKGVSFCGIRLKQEE